METTGEMRARFGEAFQRYAAEQSRAAADAQDVETPRPGAGPDPASTAERDYRAVRLEYIDRLLSGPGHE